MEVLKTKMIHGKNVRLLLNEKGLASIVYGGTTLLKDIHWDTIREDVLVCEALMDIEVSDYLRGLSQINNK